MSNHNTRPQPRKANNEALYALVRPIDIKHTQPLTEPERIRANARMEQIMLSSQTESRAALAWLKPRLTPKQVAIRLTAIPVAVAGIVGAAIILPHQGRGIPQAFASWTAIPTELDETLLAPISAACVLQLNYFAQVSDSDMADDAAESAHVFSGSFVAGSSRGIESQSDADNNSSSITPPLVFSGLPTLAEQRGDWLLLNYLSDDATLGGCIVRNAGDQPQVEVGWLQSAGSSAGFVGLGGDGEPMPGLAGGTFFSPGQGRPGTGLGDAVISTSVLAGQGTLYALSARVASDVTGIEIEAPTGLSITAKVSNGLASAWWPGAADDDPAQRAEELEDALMAMQPTTLDESALQGFEAALQAQLRAMQVARLASALTTITLTHADGATRTVTPEDLVPLP